MWLVCAAYAAAARWPNGRHAYQYVRNWAQTNTALAFQAISSAVQQGYVTSVTNGALTPAGAALAAVTTMPRWQQPYYSSPGNAPVGGLWLPEAAIVLLAEDNVTGLTDEFGNVLEPEA